MSQYRAGVNRVHAGSRHYNVHARTDIARSEDLWMRQGAMKSIHRNVSVFIQRQLGKLQPARRACTGGGQHDIGMQLAPIGQHHATGNANRSLRVDCDARLLQAARCPSTHVQTMFWQQSRGTYDQMQVSTPNSAQRLVCRHHQLETRRATTHDNGLSTLTALCFGDPRRPTLDKAV